MNYYDVTVVGRVKKYDVDKTARLILTSDCDWTEPKLTSAVVPLIERDDDMDNVRITNFQQVTDLPTRDGTWRSMNLDAALHI